MSALNYQQQQMKGTSSTVTNVAQRLAPLRTTCVPRADVLDGGLADNHFAAQLDKVLRDPEHYPVYGDAETFFTQTYPTTGLKTLISKVFGRLTGARGVFGENGVLRPTTSFGGGKTHGLTAVYHLATGARPSNVTEFVDEALLPDGAVQVAALVGDALDPTAGVETRGHRTFTLWGEMAAQIGREAFAAMAANDEARTAPGTGTIKAALGGRPTVVIVDEIAKYLRAVTSSGSEDVRRMALAVPVFLGNLFEVASDPANKVSVVITLASSANAFGAETNEVTELLDESSQADSAATAALGETSDVLTRAVQPSAVITPADDSEIGEILKKRIFKSVNDDAALAAGEAYRALYEELVGTEQLAGGPEHPATYGERVARTYPFHPELIRVLDKRLGAITAFQRARGALKLLAEVVAGIYASGEDTAIINVGDIDYAVEPVVNHLTVGLGRSEYGQVATSDFAGRSSHSAALDTEHFPGKAPHATRVARTVFTHSLELVTTSGAGRNDWLIGTLRPGEDVSFYEKALTEAEKVFWYLSFDGARWRFTAEPNVNAIVEAEKRNVPQSVTTAQVDDLIAKAFQNDAGTKVILFPAGPVDVPDSADSLRVVVLDYRQHAVEQKLADEPPAALREILDTTGSSGNPRTYRNSVVFVAPDQAQVDLLRDRARAVIAADALAGDSARLAQFTAEIRTKIMTFRDKARLDARIAVNKCYRHVYFPSGDKSNGYLRHRELSAQAVGGDIKNTTKAVLELLDDDGKIRNQPMTPQYLRAKTWADAASTTTKALIDVSWRDHSAQLVLNPGIVREAVALGIRDHGWVYLDNATGKTWHAHAQGGLSIVFAADKEVMTHEEAQKRGLLVRKPTQQDLRSVLGTEPMTGAQLRAALEALVGGEPPKGDVLDALSGIARATEYDWIVVLDAEPAAGSRALTPSQITDRGLDSLHILPREAADAAGVEIPTRTMTGKTFTAEGMGGVAMQQIVDQIADFTIQTISRLTIKVAADDASGTQDLDLAVAMLGMLPQHAITVTSQIVAEFKDVAGGLSFRASAARADYQAAHTHLKKALTGAIKVAGTLTLELRFDPPITPADDTITKLQDVITKMQLKHVAMTGEVTK
ncbi:ATP-binding protein [Promicromonospora sp. MS192]|uniref:ATP-binding protein n=1 Tax=Promicromonospora sp. MS192 TaxID=3412684 RepID=UPI003C2CE63A